MFDPIKSFRSSNQEQADDSSENTSSRGKSSDPISDDQKLNQYLEFLKISEGQFTSTRESQWRDEVSTTPLFTWPVKSLVPFPQYSILGHEVSSTSTDRPARSREECPIFLNTNAPWSAFLCGSQGSGKSHTLSCMLESCLLQAPQIGETSNPLAGIVFAYDAQSTAIACEAAYLATKVPVNVLVSPSNYHDMKKAYHQISSKIKICPLFLKQRHLSTKRMLTLMAFNNDGTGSVPLYMEVIMSILRDMRLTRYDNQSSSSSSSTSSSTRGFDYTLFKSRLKEQRFDGGQRGPMSMRLALLENFMDTGDAAQKLSKQFPALARETPSDIFAPHKGTLTIVDLTDPFVDAAGACVLFDICLSLFLESDAGAAVGGGAGTLPKIVALDEAHKFMTDEGEATNRLTESLLQVIREQRHKGVRVVIATQEPTVAPKLLDLCSMTFVHRFTSSEWLRALRGHLAGAAVTIDGRGDVDGNDGEPDVGGGSVDGDGSGKAKNGSVRSLFSQIVTLNVGESLLFSPSATLDVVDGRPRKLGVGYVKFKTRSRVTADGGSSVMATER